MQDQKPSNPILTHLRANLWLLFLTVVICCTLYPLAVWVVGQVLFHNQVQGSLVDKEGNPTSDPDKAVGSTMIAQQFNSAWFFQPRPSAASYNAAASGGSNYGASNPKLRGRVAQLLGTISRYSDAYKKAHPVPAADPMQAPTDPNPQDDIKAWFHQQTDPIQDYVLQWAKDHPDVVAAWKKDHPDSPKTLGADDAAKALTSDDLGVYFTSSYGKEHADTWLAVEAADDVQARIADWAKGHPDVVKKWQAANPMAKDGPKDEEIVAFFYQDFSKNPKDWPALESGEWADTDKNGVVTALVKPVPTDKVSFGPFADWASNSSSMSGAWATGTASIKDYILQWAKDHPDVTAAWKKDNPKVTTDPGADALAPYFFKSYAQEHPGKWPTQEAPGDVTAKITGWVKDHPDIVKKWMEANPDAKEGPKDDDLVAFFYADYPNNPKNWPPFEAGEWVDADPAVKAVVKPDAADSDVESTFFDTWLTAQVQAKKLDPLKDFVQVPADMVTTSGSGLDPDISVANAVYQKESVIPAYAAKLASDYVGRDENKSLTDEAKKKMQDDLTAKLTPQIEAIVNKLLDELPSRPMLGLTGDKPLVNVLQLNLRLQSEAAKLKVP